MTQRLYPKRSALVFGILLGGAHLLWALLVALGWAQPLINVIFWLHFIEPLYVIAPFDPGIALLLVGVTTAIGSMVGWCFAVLWNLLNRRL